MSFKELLYDPSFAVFGVDAELTVSETDGSHPIQVIDKTDGVAPPEGSFDGFAVLTLRPACFIRRADLDEIDVEVHELDGSIIEFNEKVWRIEQHLLRPTPFGELDGQVVLYLIEGEGNSGT